MTKDKSLISTNVSIDDATELDPWDLQPGESPLWFDRFTQFRLLGPHRSLAKVYRLSRLREHGKVVERDNAPSLWNARAKEWKWRERASAWDAYTLELVEEQAHNVYNSGLSLVHERVTKLQQLAQKMENYLLDSRTTRLSPHLIEQYRGTLDDIAKELGQRVKETRLTGPGGGPVAITTSWGRGGSATDAWQKVVDADDAPNTPIDREGS